ncbi:unnamed protein product, partial [Staurois parvus]
MVVPSDYKMHTISVYPLSQDPALTISGLPGPCIHYIWSPRTLHSLYPVSLDPTFTISGLPEPCIHYIWSPRPGIHYIWSPRTLHTL